MYNQYLKNNSEFQFVGQCSLENKLNSGVYCIQHTPQKGLYLVKQDIVKESLITIPDSPMYSIMDKIDNFLTDKVRTSFKKYGLLYKRGILLYGPPGTGKTSVVNQIIDIAVEKKDMIVLLNPTPAWIAHIVSYVRGIENSNRTFLVVWEEFESTVQHFENDLLNLLDGIFQIGNVIYLATTNYLQRIPQRIVNRPSRFADIFEIGYPDANVRRQFLSSKLKEDNIDIELWVSQTEGFTIDHLKDLIINVCVLDLSFKEALERTKKTVIDIPKKDEDDDCEDESTVPGEEEISSLNITAEAQPAEAQPIGG